MHRFTGWVKGVWYFHPWGHRSGFTWAYSEYMCVVKSSGFQVLTSIRGENHQESLLKLKSVGSTSRISGSLSLAWGLGKCISNKSKLTWMPLVQGPHFEIYWSRALSLEKMKTVQGFLWQLHALPPLGNSNEAEMYLFIQLQRVCWAPTMWCSPWWYRDNYQPLSSGGSCSGGKTDAKPDEDKDEAVWEVISQR